MKKLPTLTLIALFMGLGSASAAAKPMKVYIMTGQSNMKGQAEASTLAAMADDPASRELYHKLVDADGKPRVFKDVQVAALSSKKSTGSTKNGPLTVGFGGHLNGDILGTELAFGATLYEALDEPILIIKASWGGKDLNTDFRPPSAGPWTLKEAKEIWGEEKGTDRFAGLTERQHVYYHMMMEHIKTVLANPEKYHPAYDPKQGYELAGLVWFQGYNDKLNGAIYKGSEGRPPYAGYSELFAHFIRDVRSDLKAPEMPFVIGVLGIGGETDGDFQKAQAAPAEMPEFKGTVAAVFAGKYWDKRLGELADRERDMKQRARQKKKSDDPPLTPFTEDELEYLKGKSNAGFHYFGSAKIYSRIGEAFANALLDLEKK